MSIYIYTRIFIYMYIYVFIYLFVHMYGYVKRHMYIYTCIQTCLLGFRTRAAFPNEGLPVHQSPLSLQGSGNGIQRVSAARKGLC